MTDILPRDQAFGNGVQTIFTYTFRILADADIAVFVGSDRSTLNTEYTVQGAGNVEGGTVTFVTAPANDVVVTLLRDQDHVRDVTYAEAGPFFAATVNRDFDRRVMSEQQLQEQADRSIRLGPGTEYSGELLEITDDAADRLNKVFGFDGNGDLTLRDDLATEDYVIAAISASGGGTVMSVSGSGGTTGLTLTGGPITNTGTLTLDGTLAVANGGTGATTSTGTGSVVLAASPALTGNPTVPTQTAGNNSTRAASTAFVQAALAASIPVPIRQTVSAGPVTTAGLPNFLPSTNGALSITSQNVTGSAPFVATAANGWSATSGLAVNLIGCSTANLSWTGLTASRAAATPNFLYVVVNSDGTLTTGKTLVAPIYQWGGTPATTNGLFTFNIAEMKGYLGNGSTAPQANVVFVGEAATNGFTVISTVEYAYNGLYDSGFTATLPGASTAATTSHNLGVKPRLFKFVIENSTTELGYAVGDQVTEGAMGQLSTTQVVTITPWSNTKSGGIVTGNGGSGSFYIASRSVPGAWTSLTLASWKYGFIAKRGW